MRKAQRLQSITHQEAIKNALNYLKLKRAGKIPAVKTRYPLLNELLFDGIEWGWLVTIAAMPSVGKTYLLKQYTEDSLLDTDVDVVNFTLEMTPDRLIMREIASQAKTNIKSLYGLGKKPISDSELERVIKSYSEQGYHNRVTYIAERPDVGQLGEYLIAHLETISKPQRRKLFVTIDHSLLVRMNEERTGLNSLYSKLVEIKNSWKLTIIAVAQQLKRDIKTDDKRRDPKKNLFLHFPQESDIFGSDAAQQNSDLLQMLHNPSKLGMYEYGPDKWETKAANHDPYIYSHFKKVRDDTPYYVTRFGDNIKQGELWEDPHFLENELEL